MNGSLGTDPKVVLLKCPACGETSTVTVKYTCSLCANSVTLPPKPEGYPLSRSCQGPAFCQGTETGVVIACTCGWPNTALHRD